MSRNAFWQIAMLGTHPCWSLNRAGLACPLCPFVSMRIREFEDHVIAHGITRWQGYRWLSSRRYHRALAKGSLTLARRVNLLQRTTRPQKTDQTQSQEGR